MAKSLNSEQLIANKRANAQKGAIEYRKPQFQGFLRSQLNVYVRMRTKLS